MSERPSTGSFSNCSGLAKWAVPMKPLVPIDAQVLPSVS